MNLKRRVDSLEAAIKPASTISNIFVVSVAPDGRREFDRITCDGRSWDRMEGETEEAFQERAAAEAPRPRPDCVRVFYCSSAKEGD